MAPLVIVNVIALLANGVSPIHVVRYRPSPERPGPDAVAAPPADESAADGAGRTRAGAGVG